MLVFTKASSSVKRCDSLKCRMRHDELHDKANVILTFESHVEFSQTPLRELNLKQDRPINIWSLLFVSMLGPGIIFSFIALLSQYGDTRSEINSEEMKSLNSDIACLLLRAWQLIHLISLGLKKDFQISVYYIGIILCTEL